MNNEESFMVMEQWLEEAMAVRGERIKRGRRWGENHSTPNAQRPTPNERGEDRPDVRESIAAHWAVRSEIRCILRANSPCGSQFWD
jgi:hypothetical protein